MSSRRQPASSRSSTLTTKQRPRGFRAGRGQPLWKMSSSSLPGGHWSNEALFLALYPALAAQSRCLLPALALGSTGFIIEPVIVLLAFGVGLGAYVGVVDGQNYIEFIAPGIIAAYAMFSATFECTYASFIRMEHQYTYDAILATPLNVEDITAGEIFWGATRSLMTGSVILAITAAFQLVHFALGAAHSRSAFLEGIMFSAISLFFTSIVPSIYTFNYYFTLFITPDVFPERCLLPSHLFPQDTANAQLGSAPNAGGLSYPRPVSGGISAQSLAGAGHYYCLYGRVFLHIAGDHEAPVNQIKNDKGV